MPEQMSLADLLADYRSGDHGDLREEADMLWKIHSSKMFLLVAEIRQDGIREPIRIDRDERRVIDGHHRIAAALNLGLETVPVADAMVLIRQVSGYGEPFEPFTPPLFGTPVIAVCCTMAVNAYPKPCPHEDWHAFHNAVADLKAELLAGVERVMAWIGRRFRR